MKAIVQIGRRYRKVTLRRKGAVTGDLSEPDEKLVSRNFLGVQSQRLARRIVARGLAGRFNLVLFMQGFRAKHLLKRFLVIGPGRKRFHPPP